MLLSAKRLYMHNDLLPKACLVSGQMVQKLQPYGIVWQILGINVKAILVILCLRCMFLLTLYKGP